MAFLCALGVSATPTGTGTQEDPYVIADGDVYMVDDPVYASFTAPGDGTLTLSYNLMKDPAFTVVGGDVMPFTWGMGSPSTSTFIIRKSKFPPNPERSVQFSGKRTKRSVQKKGCTQHL